MNENEKRELTDLLNSDARVLIERAATRVPEDVDAGMLVGTAHLRLKEYPEAEAAFRHVVRLDPLNARALYHVGLCAERQGRSDEATGIYHRVLALDARFTKARDKLGYPATAPGQLPVGQPRSEQPAARARRDGENRSKLWLPKLDELGEYTRRMIAAARAEFKAALRSRPLWFLAIVAAVLAVPVVFVAAIMATGWFGAEDRVDKDRLEQCEHVLEEMGRDNMPPGCRELLGLDGP